MPVWSWLLPMATKILLNSQNISYKFIKTASHFHQPVCGLHIPCSGQKNVNPAQFMVLMWVWEKPDKPKNFFLPIELSEEFLFWLIQRLVLTWIFRHLSILNNWHSLILAGMFFNFRKAVFPNAMAGWNASKTGKKVVLADHLKYTIQSSSREIC